MKFKFFFFLILILAVAEINAQNSAAASSGFIPMSDAFSNEIITTRIELYNVLGKKVLEMENTSNNVDVSCDHLPRSVYFLKVTDEDKLLGILRIALE